MKFAMINCKFRKRFSSLPFYEFIERFPYTPILLHNNNRHLTEQKSILNGTHLADICHVSCVTNIKQKKIFSHKVKLFLWHDKWVSSNNTKVWVSEWVFNILKQFFWIVLFCNILCYIEELFENELPPFSREVENARQSAAFFYIKLLPFRIKTEKKRINKRSW